MRHIFAAVPMGVEGRCDLVRVEGDAVLSEFAHVVKGGQVDVIDLVLDGKSIVKIAIAEMLR